MQTFHVFYERLLGTEAEAAGGVRGVHAHRLLEVLGVPFDVDREGPHEVGHGGGRGGGSSQDGMEPCLLARFTSRFPQQGGKTIMQQQRSSREV